MDVDTITVKYTKKYTLNVNLSGASLSHFMLFQNTKHELKLAMYGMEGGSFMRNNKVLCYSINCNDAVVDSTMV